MTHTSLIHHEKLCVIPFKKRVDSPPFLEGLQERLDVD